MLSPKPTIANVPTQADDGQAVTALQFLRAEARQAKLFLSGAAFLAALGGAAMILGAWLLARLVAALIAAPPTVTPWRELVFLLAVHSARILCNMMAERLAFSGAQRIKAFLLKRMTDHAFAVSPLLRPMLTGSIVNSASHGLEALQGYFAGYLPARMTVALIPFLILAAVLPLDGISALVMAATAPVIPLFMILIGRGAEKLNQRQWRRLSFMGGYFLDLVQGLTTLKLFNASGRQVDRLAQVGEDYRRETMAVLRVAFLSALALEFFATVSIALVAVLIGFRLLAGELGFQQGFMVLLLAPEFYMPLRRLGSQYHARMAAVAAAEEIAAFFAVPSLPAQYTAAVPETAPPEIKFDDVSFRYPDGRLALDHVSFTVPPGACLALAGASGSGKSTILHLLLQFIQPQQGRILINGRDLVTIPREDWWRSLGWLPQKPRLLTGRVREAIGCADPVRLDQLLHSLKLDEPGFADRHVLEGGRDLSAGQIQRIALARALARPTRLLLMDEPTGSLDRVTEDAVTAMLSASPATRLIAAHRLRTTQDAALILVLEAGRMIALGDHAALLRDCAVYREWVRFLPQEEGP